MSTWGTTQRTDEDHTWTAITVGVLVLLLAVGVLDRAADTLDVPRTITGTVIADDPDSPGTVTSVPDSSR